MWVIGEADEDLVGLFGGESGEEEEANDEVHALGVAYSFEVKGEVLEDDGEVVSVEVDAGEGTVDVKRDLVEALFGFLVGGGWGRGEGGFIGFPIWIEV